MGAHTLAWPASMPSCTSGSHVQRSWPVRASSARTVPRGAETRTLSAMAEPTTTTPCATTGAEVIWISPGHRSDMPTSSLTSPSTPKSAQGAPILASRAITRMSLVPMKMRARQTASGGACWSTQLATPRQLKRLPGRWAVLILGSKRHFCAPLPGSRAITSLNGEHRIRLSSTKSGVVWNLMRAMTCGSRRARSPVRNSQARMSLPTLSGVISASAENRVPPWSPPQCSHASADEENRPAKTKKRIPGPTRNASKLA